MNVDRDEAVSLLRKWMHESALLQCNLSLPILSAFFRGKIFKLSDSEVGLVADGVAELALSLPAFFSFRYDDARRTDDPNAFEGMLWIVFREGKDATDYVSLAELKK
jgi:hypothetical protein